MPLARFRFHGDLNAFLTAVRRDAAVDYGFDGQPAVKDAIEALGVPHPEVAAIVVNGTAVGFDRRLRDGDRVEVFPADEAVRLPAGSRTAPPPPAEPRFVLDTHLGRLAAYLRMLGFDTRYRNDAHDEEIAHLAADEDRILLTRDRGLLKRGIVARGAFLRSDLPREQLAEVVRRFALRDQVRPFGRCLRCNGLLARVAREAVDHLLEPLTRRYYDDFRRCEACGAVYWRGSHYERMRRLIEHVLGEPEEG